MTRLADLFLALLVLASVTNCGTRKVEYIKEIDKLESIEKDKATSLDWSSFIVSKDNTEIVNEVFKDGVIEKRQTYKRAKSIKAEVKIKRVTKTTYKTITTFKSIKSKSVERKEPWLTFGVGFVVLALLIYYLIKK